MQAQDLVKRPRKGARVETITVRGLEDVAAARRSADELRAECEREIARLDEEIIAACERARADRPDIRTLDIVSADGAPLRVVVADRWRPLEASRAGEIRAALGEHARGLLIESITIRPRAPMTRATLEAAMGAQAVASLETICEIESTLSLGADATRRALAVRPLLPDEGRALLDGIMAACRYKPSVRS